MPQVLLLRAGCPPRLWVADRLQRCSCCPMTMTLLSADAIAALPALLPGWQVLEGERLQRQFRFADFSEAFAFMTRVALLAEVLGHHPDWSNSWNRVTITLTTHDAGGLTSLDQTLAERIQQLVA